MNLEQFKQITLAQYEAAFSTINEILAKVPDDVWAGKVANHPFSQSFFHTLFFGDVYLAQNLDEMKQQAFHIEHADSFRDYEELEQRAPVLTYAKSFVEKYLKFCIEKARSVMAEESEESLASVADFPWHTISRAELHLYNIRHLQHHAAQMIMRLRLDKDAHTGWYKSGWEVRD